MFKFSGSPGGNLQRRRAPSGHWKNCVGWMRQPQGVRPGEASGVTVAAGASASPTSSARASSERKDVGSPSAPRSTSMGALANASMNSGGAATVLRLESETDVARCVARGGGDAISAGGGAAESFVQLK